MQIAQGGHDGIQEQAQIPSHLICQRIPHDTFIPPDQLVFWSGIFVSQPGGEPIQILYHSSHHRS
jgi:hypothetical protein